MAKDSTRQPDDEPLRLDDDEPIRLEDEPGTLAAEAAGAMRTFGVQGKETVKSDFRRPLNTNGTGATRVRLFHSKIAVPSLEFMGNQINEWIDGEQIEIKQVGHLIGTMEGKRPEPNLLLVVWY